MCACGCGAKVSPTKTSKVNKYISGHNRQGRRKVAREHTCAFCKENFFTMPYVKFRTFCSQACRDGYRKVHRVGPNQGFTVRTCRCCGVEYTRLHDRNLRYCSRECGAKMKSERISEAMQRRYADASGAAAKLRAKERDQHKCVVCGFDAVVHGHHLIPKSQGGPDELSNLVTLCPNHHAMAHAGLLSVKEILRFMQDRTER